MSNDNRYLVVGFSKAAGPVLLMEYLLDFASENDGTRARFSALLSESVEPQDFDAPSTVIIPELTFVDYRGQTINLAGVTGIIKGKMAYLDTPIEVQFQTSEMHVPLTLNDIDGLLFCKLADQDMLAYREVNCHLMTPYDLFAIQESNLDAATDTVEKMLHTALASVQRFRDQVLTAGFSHDNLSFSVEKSDIDDAMQLYANGYATKMTWEVLVQRLNEHVNDSIDIYVRAGGKGYFDRQAALNEITRLEARIRELTVRLER
ncbi:hypothetical protein RYA05_03665 [Pseudomonas syringae pv. actinidiae]|nr:hypothetical protein [Pseudomonas syringae pv. actinidiae]